MNLPADPEARQAIAVALRLLASRSRLNAELAAELRRRGSSEESIEAAVAFLSKHRLSDDGQAAREFVESRTGRRAVGRKWFAERLRQRGAPEELIEEALGDWGDEVERNALRAAFESKTWGPGDRGRAGRFLDSRGFDSEQIENELNARFGERVD